MKTAVIELARRALPLMRPERRHEAEQLIARFEHTANAQGDTDPRAEYLPQAARAFAADLQPVRTAIIAALHADAWEGLKALLPGLLHQVNEQPTLATVLARAMVAVIDDGDAFNTANAVSVDRDPVVTDAMRTWRGKAIFETDLGSAELRTFSRELLDRSIFSARVTNADFLQEISDVVDEMLSGKINQATGRLRLLMKLKELGYDPEIGFPGDMANVPPAERGSLQDISSERRLNLILETNLRMAAGCARAVAGNQPYALHAYPAWELVRLYHREVPRGEKRVHGVMTEDASNSWHARWEAAGDSVGWEGALRSPWIATKDSPIWQALGDGAGGYRDTLGHNYEPYAFQSGMGRRAVPRAEAERLGVLTAQREVRPVPASLSPGEEEISRAIDRLSPALRAMLERRARGEQP